LKGNDAEIICASNRALLKDSVKLFYERVSPGLIILYFDV